MQWPVLSLSVLCFREVMPGNTVSVVCNIRIAMRLWLALGVQVHEHDLVDGENASAGDHVTNFRSHGQ